MGAMVPLFCVCLCWVGVISLVSDLSRHSAVDPTPPHIVDDMETAARVRQIAEAHGIGCSDVALGSGVMPIPLTRIMTADTHPSHNTSREESEKDAQVDAIANDRLHHWCHRLSARSRRRRVLSSRFSFLPPVPTVSPPPPPPPRAALMVPIHLELSLTNFDVTDSKVASGVAAFADTFVWNIDGSLTPREFLTTMLTDLGMELELWLQPLEQRMNQQIEQFRKENGRDILTVHEQAEGVDSSDTNTAARAPSNSTSNPALPTPAADPIAVEPVEPEQPTIKREPNETNQNTSHNQKTAPRLITIPVDLIHNGLWVQDTLELDPSNRFLDPFSFADVYVRDVGLPAEFSVKLAAEIQTHIRQYMDEHKANLKLESTPLQPVATSSTSDDDSDTPVLEFRNFDSEPSIRHMTVRHNIAVLQRPPPPYIAHYTSHMHRHALLFDDQIDVRELLPTTLPGTSHTTYTYSFLRSTETTISLRKHKSVVVIPPPAPVARVPQRKLGRPLGSRSSRTPIQVRHTKRKRATRARRAREYDSDDTNDDDDADDDDFDDGAFDGGTGIVEGSDDEDQPDAEDDEDEEDDEEYTR